MANDNGMIDLSESVVNEHQELKAEEQQNANYNYRILENLIHDTKSNLPYPDVGPYTVADGNYSVADIQAMKKSNAPYWEEEKELKRYFENGRLFCGRVVVGGVEHFITDKSTLETQLFSFGNAVFHIINAEDVQWKHIVNHWLFPDKKNKVSLSRNIYMSNKLVNHVDVKLDIRNKETSEVTDTFLRNAMLYRKSKNMPGAESIIMTIQKKQDDICELPINISLVLQGCAGSGKTMVLLHRLKRQLHRNTDITSQDYIYLIPSVAYRDFVKKIAEDFRINEHSIMLYQEYYQNVCGQSKKEYENELVFSNDYLSRVYSEEFIRAIYKNVLFNLCNRFNVLYDICENKISELYSLKERKLQEKVTTAQNVALSEIMALTSDIQEYVAVKLEDSLDNVYEFLEALHSEYKKKKDEYDELVKQQSFMEISDDDPRLLADLNLQTMRRNLEKYSQPGAKGPAFMERIRKAKVEKLKAAYEKELAEKKKQLIEEDKKQNSERLLGLKNVFGCKSFYEVEEILDKLEEIITKYENDTRNYNEDLVNFEQYFLEVYPQESKAIQEAGEWSEDLYDRLVEYSSSLKACNDFLQEYSKECTKLLNAFGKYFVSKDERDIYSDMYKYFADKKSGQVESLFKNTLFNACKKSLRDEFDVKLCDLYKHYWYLSAYCRYLAQGAHSQARKYIFIDEAQDLSLAEITLIKKLNAKNANEMPVINLFGDINQMITEHGIKNWSDISQISKIETLEENFRNTNQIVDFCNKNLPASMKMQDIGVDMEPVKEFKTIRDALNVLSQTSTKVFIVKDEYAVKDLQAFMIENRIANASIYTVKASKGLEFRDIFVIDKDMTDKERYIAYTRALVNLTVIRDMPYKADRKNSLVVEGK